MEDELMVQNILEANPNSEYMYVIDTRPKVQCVYKLASFPGLLSYCEKTGIKATHKPLAGILYM